MNFDLEVGEENIVLQGLGELPAKLSMNLIQKVQEQAAAQMQPGMEAAEEEK